MQWFDAGVNASDKRLTRGWSALAASAAEAGVEHWLCIGTTPSQSEQQLALLQEPALNNIHLSFTAGCHPHHADDWQPEWEPALRALLMQPQVVAVGECGLDFNRCFSSKENQQRVFAQQLSLAQELGKPLYLHERDAFDTQVAMLREQIPSAGGIAHCFTGSQQQLRTYLDLGLFIGITGWLCDPARGEALRLALDYLPLDRLILETDAPYLAPKDIKPRPKFCSPAHIPHIAAQVAQLKGVPVAQVAQQCWFNTQQFLGIATA